MKPEMGSDLWRRIIGKTYVGTQAEQEKADYHLCASESHNAGDIQGNCCLCHRVVYWSPATAKKPKRICLQCLLIETKGILPERLGITSSGLADSITSALRDLTKK